MAITRINEFKAKGIQAVMPLLEAPATGAYYRMVGGAEE